MPEPALGLRFTVVIDGHGTLGNWTKCEGLTVEYDVHEYAEGGLNGYVHRLPGRAKYQNIKLTRPIDAFPYHARDESSIRLSRDRRSTPGRQWRTESRCAGGALRRRRCHPTDLDEAADAHAHPRR